MGYCAVCGVSHVDLTWDPLRDHPRFQALLERYE
jgi:hypothetical protein